MFAFLGQGPGSLLLVLRMSVFSASVRQLKYMLMGHFSFAIWNRNKGIAATVAAIWVTNVSLLLLGESSLVSPSR
jgi:hypothetical protein